MIRLTEKQIETLPTKRLLKYYKKYRNHRWAYWCGICCDYHDEEDEKAGEELNAYFDSIKSELNKREHVA